MGLRVSIAEPISVTHSLNSCHLILKAFNRDVITKALVSFLPEGVGWRRACGGGGGTSRLVLNL